MLRGRVKGLTLAVAASLSLGLSVPGLASGATITPTIANDELTGGGLGCSLREAVESINQGSDQYDCIAAGPNAYGFNDLIRLNNASFVLSQNGAGEDNNLTGDLDIRKTLAIDSTSGNPDISQTFATDDRIIDIPITGVTVSINNLQIKVGEATAAPPFGNLGGNILFRGDSDDILQLVNVDVLNGLANNGANGGRGGGIATTNGAQVLVEANTQGNGSLVRDNVAGGAVAGFGGGIDMSGGGSLTVTGSDISSNDANEATGAGGGIALADGAALTANGDSAINDNVSAGLGGGIYKDGDGDVTLNQGVTVDGNDAVGRGGGIYGFGTNTALTLNGASVSNNDLTENASSVALGSAIHYVATSAFSFTGAQINGNDAVADTAIAALELVSSSASTITGSTISGNTVTGQVDGNGDLLGPAAMRLNVSGGTTISNSTISQNVTNNAEALDSNNGAGVYALGPLTITDSTFASNGFTGPGTTRGGGALYIESAALTTAKILNSTFTANNGPDFGGAINLQAGGQLTIGQSTFSGNVSPQGAAINAQGNPTSSITLRGTIFDDGAGACSNLSNVGTVNANSFNVDAGTSCVDQPDMPNDTDFENTDSLLGVLASNGGPTQTMRLLGPANLFNAAGACKQLDGTTNLLVDQRGFPRPAEGACEPGAYERFICNGVELMSPGPFPGCMAPPPGPGDMPPASPTNPISPTALAPAPATSSKKKCKRKKRRTAAAAKKCKKRK